MDREVTNAPGEALRPSEPLTWDEIRRRYPDQWVFLVDLEGFDEEDETVEWTTARVLAHGRRNNEVEQRVRGRWERYRIASCRYTGRLIPPQFEILPIER